MAQFSLFTAVCLVYFSCTCAILIVVVGCSIVYIIYYYLLYIHEIHARFNKCIGCLPQSQSLIRASGYCRFMHYCTLGHVGGGNSCGWHTLMRVAMTHAG
jgi:type II secretory pathway component PulF